MNKLTSGACACARAAQARMEGMGAKEGFHKNAMANNDSCDLNGKDMNKWTQPVHWGTNESRGTPGAVNGAGYGSLAGMAVLGGGGCNGFGPVGLVEVFDGQEWQNAT